MKKLGFDITNLRIKAKNFHVQNLILFPLSYLFFKKTQHICHILTH